MVDLREETTEKVEDKNEKITAEQDFLSPTELFSQLVNNYRRYRPDDDISKIVEAFTLAKQAHMGQRRKSGEPYIIHPVSVALILSELEMDKDSIIAGILHDVVEDTDITADYIKERFGEEVALLVDGVTKLDGIKFTGSKEETQAENLRKMFIAMAQDIRVVIIKLADRTHNMRTLQFMTPEKQAEKATETLEIYSPIADRLGISRIKIELDNLSLQYLEPEAYAKLVEEIDQKKGKRENYIEGIVDEVREEIAAAHINAEVYGRVKHFFSIYKKMKTQNKSVDEIYDIFAIRVIVNTKADCYAILGLIHGLYTPIPGRIKDYIAMPKPNHYQSLHTTVIGKDGVPFEIQIRTHEMHRIAEYGIAAHWKYKEVGSGEAKDGEKPINPEKPVNPEETINPEEEKISWLRQILEWQKEMPDDREFLASIKQDLNLYSEKVYCFTPNGDIKVLPAGSTPIDFAYFIHSAVGNKMVGARVNGRLVTIDYQLRIGDQVEIVTSQNSKGPSRDWLKICKTTQAKNKINQWFRAQNKEENIDKGREALEAYCKSVGVELPELTKPAYIEKIVRKYGFHDWDAVMAAVGHGGLKEGQVINRLIEEKTRAEKKVITDEAVLAAVAENKKSLVRKSTTGIIVEGIDDMSVHMARCCSPIPGDEIVGFVTRGRGISIHRTDCVNLLSLPESERARMIEAEWAGGESQNERFTAQIAIYCANRVGMVADISRILTEENINIRSLTSQVNKQNVATITVDFDTSGVNEINRLIAKLKQIEGVVDIERTTG